MDTRNWKVFIMSAEMEIHKASTKGFPLDKNIKSNTSDQWQVAKGSNQEVISEKSFPSLLLLFSVEISALLEYSWKYQLNLTSVPLFLL